jgi:hypothetical protein
LGATGLQNAFIAIAIFGAILTAIAFSWQSVSTFLIGWRRSRTLAPADMVKSSESRPVELSGAEPVTATPDHFMTSPPMAPDNDNHAIH